MEPEGGREEGAAWRGAVRGGAPGPAAGVLCGPVDRQTS